MLTEIEHTVGAQPRLPDHILKLLQDYDIAKIKSRGNRGGIDKKGTTKVNRKTT